MTERSQGAGRTLLAAVVVGTIGWVGLTAVAIQLWAISPATLGFDLELLLQAGRDIAAGRSPYAPELIAGGPPVATRLFYSYPPPVGQALAPFAGLPTVLALVAWGLLATLGHLGVSELLRRRLAPQRPASVVALVALAAVPLTLPLAVGLLFGNLDAFFPLLYGLMLVATLMPAGAAGLAGGAALSVATLKLHPGSMGLWFLIRAVRDRGSGAGRVVGGALVVTVAIIVMSVVVGGPQAWLDYAAVVRAGSNAIVVDPRNAGIAATMAGALGGGDGLARSLHLVVGGAALAVTAWAAWRRADPLEGFAWAAAASLATLPVTWYHYPSALVPVAMAAWLRADGAHRWRVVIALVSALIVAAVAIAAVALVWGAVALVILASRWSRPRPAVDPRSPGAPLAPAPEAG